MNCIRNLKSENCNFSNQTFFKFGDLLGIQKLVTNAKFQLDISKIVPVRQKITRTWDVNTTLTAYWFLSSS